MEEGSGRLCQSEGKRSGQRGARNREKTGGHGGPEGRTAQAEGCLSQRVRQDQRGQQGPGSPSRQSRQIAGLALS